MVDEDDYLAFHETCRLANYFGKQQNTKVIIIVHSETFYDFISGVGKAYENIVNMFRQNLKIFPYIRIGIENVTPIRSIGSGKELHLSNNFKFDNVEMVKRLRYDIPEFADRINTVLDTCHAMISKKYIDSIYREVNEDDKEPEDLALEGYFEKNAETCCLIHFAGMKGSGYGNGRHGTPFHLGNKEEMSMCHDILSLYFKYHYTCPLTLEVEDTDFAVSDGYHSTRDAVVEACSHFGVVEESYNG